MGNNNKEETTSTHHTLSIIDLRFPPNLFKIIHPLPRDFMIALNECGHDLIRDQNKVMTKE